MTSRRPSAPIGASVHGLAQPVAHVDQPRQVLGEAVEKVRAHGGDDEQRAVGVLQRAGEQPIEAAALVRIGEGEQLLELVDGEQEGGVVAACGSRSQ